MLSVGKVVIFLTGLLQYLAKNMALLVQKLWRGGKFNIRFRIFRKKTPVVTKLDGGGIRP